jgi:malate/lactate dehydrogenase
MAVLSDGNSYGVAEGLIFSFPVTCQNGSWKIVDGYQINDFSRQALETTAAELLDEKRIGEEILNQA